MQPDDLQKLSRGELIEQATSRGVPSADALTRGELIDEITKRAAGEEPPAGMLGLLSVASELVARVVDRRLHMPEAAKLIREMAKPRRISRPPPPLPTVTLAEIYAAQGHHAKALAVLDEVLSAEPDHGDARSLRERLAEELAAAQAAEAAALDAATADRGSGGDAARDSEADSGPDRKVGIPPAEAETDPGWANEDAAEDEANAFEASGSIEVVGNGGASAIAPAARPFPSRYDVDELVALATDPHTVYVYWELQPLSFARAHHVDPGGQLVVRALTVLSDALGVVSDSRDIPVDQMVGDRFIHGLQPGAELRLCLGWNGPEGFLPLAVAEALQMPRDHSAPTPAVSPMGHEALAATVTGAPHGGTASAAANSRLRSYQAQLASQSTSAPKDGPGGMAGLDPSAAPIVVHISKARATVGGGPLGGASELMGPGEYSGRSSEAFGGASDLYGGASDLYGGASDLYGGTGDLSK
jgi:hypothetical protein